MAGKTDEADGCTFQWKIENILHCWLKKGERLASPAFIADAVEGTKWSLSLYPMGDEDENFVDLYLFREDCGGPNKIDVNFQLSFLDKDGSILIEYTILDYNFGKCELWGYNGFVSRERMFVSERETYLPEDTLTVQCTIWNKRETPVKPTHLYARTVFEVNRKYFLWKINEFSTLKSAQKNNFKDDFINFDLCLNEEIDSEKEIVININHFDVSMKYLSFKISVVNSSGIKENCGHKEYFTVDLMRGVLPIPATPFLKKLKENKNQYLQNDVLSLHCEYVISSATGLRDFFGSVMISPKLKAEVVDSRKNYSEKENTPNISVVNDLRSMYNDAVLCDIELRTSTRNFPAHKSILSARSPVFRNMFCNDMKEKNSGRVDIADFDDDTIHRMLLYMYTDCLEDLQFESASNLYTIADKYEILSLKVRCSSFLKYNLCPTNACEVLVQADLHHDDDLTNAVQDYILGQGKEIFSSQQWKEFMNTHLKLAADVMFRKIFQE